MGFKLPNGYGSIYKLSGKRRRPYAVRKTVGWTMVWYCDRKTRQEIRKSYPVYQFVGYYASRKEAIEALSEYNRDPYDLRINAMTFADLYEKWSAEHYKKLKSTRHYVAAYKALSYLHPIKVIDVRFDHIVTAFEKSGKNEATQKVMKVLITQLFDYAALHEIIPENRAAGFHRLEITRENPDARPHEIFSPADREALWNCSGDRTARIVLILIYTGMRISELLGLRREDVHLEERYLHLTDAKTKAGIRDVPIAEKIVPLVDEFLREDDPYLIRVDTDSTRKDARYERLTRNEWSCLMDRLQQKHTPHDTRHTCATMLEEAGVDLVTRQAILGHSAGNVTDAVYTKVGLDLKLHAINKL